MKVLEGYDKKEIYQYSNEELEEIKKSGNEKLIIKTYLNLMKSWYYQTEAETGKLALTKGRELKPLIQKIFESTGWEVHIDNNNNNKSDCYIHDSIGYTISVHQVPFCHEWNIDLTDEELFNGDELRTKEETLELLRKRKGEKSLDLEQMYKNKEINKLDYDIIKKIMKEEGLTEIHGIDIDSHIFRCGAKEYKYYYDYDDVEKEAREYLSDGETWRMAVEAEKTTLSLKEWVEDILNMDGAFSIVNSYDGMERYITIGKKKYPYMRIS